MLVRMAHFTCTSHPAYVLVFSSRLDVWKNHNFSNRIKLAWLGQDLFDFLVIWDPPWEWGGWMNPLHMHVLNVINIDLCFHLGSHLQFLNMYSHPHPHPLNIYMCWIANQIGPSCSIGAKPVRGNHPIYWKVWPWNQDKMTYFANDCNRP